MWVTACVSINGVCAFHENTSLSSFCICTGIFFQQSIDWSVFVSQRANLVKLPSCSHFSPISSAYYFSVHYRHTRFGFFFLLVGNAPTVHYNQLCWLQRIHHMAPVAAVINAQPCHTRQRRAVPACHTLILGKMSAKQLKVQERQSGDRHCSSKSLSHRDIQFSYLLHKDHYVWLISVGLFCFVLFFSHRINCCWYLGSDFLPSDDVWGKQKKYSLSNNSKVVNNENSLYVKLPVPCSL